MAEKTKAKKIGDIGETVARQYLCKKGYHILEKNYRIPGGEIDIIACDRECVVFVEVKTRNTSSLDRPSTWVDRRKQKKLMLTAVHYLEENETDLQPRFDVIEVIYDKRTEMIVSIEHIENAFIQTDDYAVY